MAVFRYPLSTLEKHPHYDLMQALDERPRRIPSKYFYDDRGSRLFERITDLEEYYPTACESEILHRHARDILTDCGVPKYLNLVELGAGDGRKTLHLLKAARDKGVAVNYRPVDISAQALDDLQARLHESLPDLRIEPAVMDIEREFEKLPIDPKERNLVLYLGSSLGNFTPDEQRVFLDSLCEKLHSGDRLLLGLDLKKDPAVLQKAYDDSKGVTRAFNMNLLERLNREVHADFNPNRFKHVAVYNPSTGAMESWLLSLEEQSVHLRNLNMSLHLDAFEAIHTETSWKFSPRDIKALAHTTGFTRLASFTDYRGYFCDELWTCP
ncbi:MAG: L-histidine N(alpha)-methyltransferase [Bdellovibrionales bacterium]|nr:L-histidine N(alpha)-methyltransferase [Bdellovibrionales bacterium]